MNNLKSILVYMRAVPWLRAALSVFVCVVLVVFFASAAPLKYPLGAVIRVPEGASVRDVARILKDRGAISSTIMFELYARVFGGAIVQSGAYGLHARESALTLALRLKRGDAQLEAKSILIHEGMTSWEIADRLATELSPDFDVVRFLERASLHEGYLFPDTYIWTEGASADTVFETLRSTFDTKALPLIERASTTRTVHEVVTMASIIEREARQSETMKIVSGILWERIRRGMPLQVDAVFGYINKRPTYSPSFAELKVDSPYNTYTRKGLPPGPISNPGATALDAALNPTKTPYLFYLTGADGTMHYARTFEEHVANRRFLR